MRMIGSPMSVVTRCHQPPRSLCLAVTVQPRLHGPWTVVLAGLAHDTPSAARHLSSLMASTVALVGSGIQPGAMPNLRRR